MKVRPPAVSGLFYPDSALELATLVDALVDEAEVDAGSVGGRDAGSAAAAAGDVPGRRTLAYVVPHAGYRYSGRTAATAYARLRREAASVRRVVLLGPAHQVSLVGCAASTAQRWSTPLGQVPVDLDGLPAMAARDERPHVPEHSIEIQIPFLQRVLGSQVPVVPLCVGRTPDEYVAEVIATAIEPDPLGTLVLCSTDLSHFLTQDQATVRDRRTADAVTSLAPERIGTGDACGLFALRGLLRWASVVAAAGGDERSHIATELLDLRTSAQAGGDPGRVVGYGAFAVRVG